MRPRTVMRRLSPTSAVAALAVLVLAGYPLEELARQSLFGSGGLSLDAYRRLANAETLTALRQTLAVSLAATLTALIIGGALALLLQRSDLPGRRLFAVLALLPLLIPPFAGALAWLDAYDRGGLTFRWWGLTIFQG